MIYVMRHCKNTYINDLESKDRGLTRETAKILHTFIELMDFYVLELKQARHVPVGTA